MTDETQEQSQEQQPSWFIEEGKPGVGERPNWLPEKYKSAADLAKAHSELEKRLGTAPDKYDLSKSKFIDPDYEPFQDFLQTAKDKRVPQEVIDKMVDSVNKYMDEFSTDYEEEIKKLGDNARDRIITLDNWAKANLSEDSYKALTSSLNNADSVKALEEIRGKMMSNIPSIPTDKGATEAPASVEDIKIELSNNLEKYKSDPKYREDLQKRLALAAKNAPGYVDKIGA